VILGPGPAPIKPLPGSNGDVDRRPHSRACGIRYHLHGYGCARDCPTCHGVPTPGANE
jgi:pyruvate-formate lyase-activating enzyme